MSDITVFKCRNCDGTGSPTRREAPRTRAGNVPVCCWCDGTGKIKREVEDTFDRQGRMSAISLLYREGGPENVTADELQKASAKEANWFADDWENASSQLPFHRRLNRKRARHSYADGEKRVFRLQAKPKPKYKIKMITTGKGRRAPRIALKVAIRPPFDPATHRAGRHYRGSFDLS